MKRLLLLLLVGFSQVLMGTVIFVSDRADFVDPDEISQRTVKAKYTTGDSGLEYYDLIGEGEWKKALDGKRVAILVHGYNNDFKEAKSFFKKVMKNSDHLYDTFVCYFWPGGDHQLEYFEARENAVGILPERFLSIARDVTAKAASADIFAHSMGCRLSLEMMQYPSSVALRNLFLMAPAVDNKALEEWEIYHAGLGRCESIFIFHSLRDDVLKWAYPLGDYDAALGYSGTEDIEDLPNHVFHINCTRYIGDHGAYADSKFVFKVVEEILKPAAL